jgi:cyclohexanecarboxylate-CoA ligase
VSPATAGAALPCDRTSAAWLAEHAAERPDVIAYRDADHGLTYGRLHDMARSVAEGLRWLGVSKGDVVAAQLPNGLEFLLTYLGASHLGAVLQPIHMPYRQADVLPLLRHSGAKVAVALSCAKDHSPAESMLAMRAQLPALTAVAGVGETAPAGAVAFRELLRCPVATPVAVAADDHFLLLYTSGTTAAPKGVPVDFGRFLENARRCAPEMGISAGSTLLSAAPFTHLYGLLSAHLCLVTGATTAALPNFSPDGFAAALDAYRPSAVFVAPAHIAGCAALGLLTAERLSSVELVMISGSACPPELARSLQALMPGGKVCQLWGMSELQVGAFTRPDDPLETRMSGVGRASPGTELRIDDGRGGPDREGELQVRGGSVFQGYLANPAASAAAFTPDGWFRTGDLASMTTSGEVRITGRLKDVINRGGVKFNPADVEAILELHPAVASCAIVPMPDPALGERACCFVVLQAAARFDLDEMRAWLDGRGMTKNKWPEHLEIIAEIPMTPTRKIKKAALIARFAAPE